jgi:hypothetical protein
MIMVAAEHALSLEGFGGYIKNLCEPFVACIIAEGAVAANGQNLTADRLCEFSGAFLGISLQIPGSDKCSDSFYAIGIELLLQSRGIFGILVVASKLYASDTHGSNLCQCSIEIFPAVAANGIKLKSNSDMPRLLWFCFSHS